jgi:short-subunit dehydrogenase
VNVSSINAMFTNPNNGPHCTSKFAIRGFTLTLAQELRGSTVNVSCVYPGGVSTNIIRNARFRKASRTGASKTDTVAWFDKYLAWTSPDRAGRVIVKGIRKNKARTLVGADAYVYDILARVAPSTWQRMVPLLS